MISTLLLNTCDGSLTEFKVRPQGEDTQAEFAISYYQRGNGAEDSISGVLRFSQVASLDLEVNFFDNPIGAELGGFYEILDDDFKRQILEKIFANRKEGYLFHGDYNYVPLEPADILNFRPPMEDVLGEMDRYRLFQLQTQGGIYHILCRHYQLIEN